ncbi:MAG: UDP-N-acetylglucosamine 1-carboxyvinyltransferase [Christensenellales bacterium]
MMEKLKIHSGHKLYGSLDICSSKNAILPMLAGSVLCGGKVTLNKIPNFSDISKMCEILASLGAKITMQDDILQIDSSFVDKYLVSNDLGKDLRGSIILLGALLSKFRFGVVGYPGGCNIGSRPIDLHLKGLRALGVKITEEHGYLFCDGKNMKPATIVFEKVSVGATENLMLASVLLKGKTVLKNVAKEPEIVDLANFLNGMGARVVGAGTNKITIYGVDKLHDINYTPIADRIVAGTYMVAVAMTGGNVEFCNINPKHLSAITKKLAVCGCNVDTKNDKIILSANERCKALKSITTGAYPKFPTDMQSLFLSLQSISKGKCTITENLFEGRFKQVPELIKMGADIKVMCNMAYVNGVEKLSGADVTATDLRAGAGLVLCGLVADGYTTVYDIHHIDRGYDHIENDLSKLGADIVRLN